MRPISAAVVACFAVLVSAVLAVALLAAWAAWPLLLLAGHFTGELAIALVATVFYLGIIATYRAVFAVVGLPIGDIPFHSRAERVYHLHLLFFAVFFQPIMASVILPLPLMRAFYLALGARLGDDTYSGGILYDPLAVRVGAGSIIAQGSVVTPHVIERDRLAILPIAIGSGVTVGANSVILADVEIGDGAMVAAGSVVAKGTRIAAGEIWGGVPAKRLRAANGIEFPQIAKPAIARAG